MSFISRPPVSSARPLVINHRCSQEIQHPSNLCLPLQPDMPGRMFNLSMGYIFHFPILETVHRQLLEKGRRSKDLDDASLCPIQSDLFTNSGARQKQKDASVCHYWTPPAATTSFSSGDRSNWSSHISTVKNSWEGFKVDVLDFRPEITAIQLPYEFLHFYRLNSRTWKAATQQHIKSSTAWRKIGFKD